MLCIVRFARLPASAVRLTVNLLRSHASWDFLLRTAAQVPNTRVARHCQLSSH